MSRPCKYRVTGRGIKAPQIEFSTKYKDAYYAIIRAKRMRELLPSEYTSVMVIDTSTDTLVWDSRNK